MESTSEAMKIQVSQATYNILQQVGGFVLKQRGEIDVKVSTISLKFNDNPLSSAPLEHPLGHKRSGKLQEV